MPASPRELVWAPAARRDLINIWAYYTDVASSDVAERLLHDIDRAALRLLRHPESGRRRSDIAPPLRSMLVRPYAVLYRATDTVVEIVRVLHTRRDLAAAFAEDV